MRKIGLWALVILGLVLGGCLKTPKGVLQISKNKMMEVKTYHYQVNTETNLAIKDQIWKMRCGMEGDLDNSQDQPNARNDAKFSVSNDSNLNFDLGFNLVTIKEMLYIQLAKLDLPAALLSGPGSNPGQKQMLGIYNFVNGLKGQWIKFDLSEFYRKQELDPKVFLEKQKKFTSEAKKLAARTDFVAAIENLGDANLQNTACFHYRVNLDKNKILQFALAYRDLAAQTFGDKSFPAKDQQNFETGIKDFLAKCGDLNAEIWIGKKDYYMYGFKTSLEIVPSPTMEKISVPVNASFSRYNEPINITAPQGAKTFMEMLPKKPFSLPGIMPSCPVIPNMPKAKATPPMTKPTLPKTAPSHPKDSSSVKPL